MKGRHPIDSFCSRVVQAGADDCWLWTGETNNQGYGRFCLYPAGRRVREFAHRFAYALATCQDIRGLVVLHACDNPRCCNPAHLSVGTQLDNMADARAKGRTVPPPRITGSQMWNAKLTEASVVAIRQQYAAGTTQRALAAKFGVEPSSISQVVLGKSWRHAPGPLVDPALKRRATRARSRASA